MKKLLEMRKKVKSRKPRFLAQGAGKLKEVKERWRRPKGLQSKQRLRKKGHQAHVETGYRSPTQVRGMHPTGVVPVVVSTKKELESLKQGEGAVLSAMLGMKKKKELVALAVEKKMTILNMKQPEEYIKKTDAALAERKKKLQERALAKKKTEEKKKASDEKKEKEAAPAADEETLKEQKMEEKREHDKLLTKKE